jgi:hypothetical protein
MINARRRYPNVDGPLPHHTRARTTAENVLAIANDLDPERADDEPGAACSARWLMFRPGARGIVRTRPGTSPNMTIRK